MVALLFLWFRKVISPRVGEAWHSALVVRALMSWAEAETAAGDPLGVDFGGRRSCYEKIRASGLVPDRLISCSVARLGESESSAS